MGASCYIKRTERLSANVVAESNEMMVDECHNKSGTWSPVVLAASAKHVDFIRNVMRIYWRVFKSGNDVTFLRFKKQSSC